MLLLVFSKLSKLSPEEFKDLNKQQETFAVLFYAPWCGHCKQFMPEYTAAAESLEKSVKLYAMDCDKQENKGVCGQQGVQGFPTMKIYHSKDGKKGITYEGGRTESDVISWVKSMVKLPFELSRGKKVNKIATEEGDALFIITASAKPSKMLITFGKMLEKRAKVAGIVGFNSQVYEVYKNSPLHPFLLDTEEPQIIARIGLKYIKFEGTKSTAEIEQWLKSVFE
ncbi:Protein disulfide isomerase [Spironucleus salmonicida]|uniref:Protein disulfide isomerase n=1 Tax=Spironucleus salmonicida TaxID=348837 RepID=V6LBU9_9EUKA|nr:Protein disulfide isomerase [Spironucleus salmonicida]|eukprot:EST41970.1 Protein disulfide isomerase [Spironucleus salmonicida]